MANVLVVGGGPAGLLAAWAAERADVDNLDLVVPGLRMSRLGGCMYLHKPIDGIELTPQSVTYALLGTADGYRRKVYGNAFPELAVSPDSLVGVRSVYDIRGVYALLWQRYRNLMTDRWVEQSQVPELLRLYDLVVWTAPAPAACILQATGQHWFRSAQVWGMERAIQDIPEMSVLCNGADAPSWYRVANVFGSQTTEWPGDIKPPIPSLQSITKPVATNCDCWQGDGEGTLLRVGRYGTWRKGVLAHHAYEEVRQWFTKEPASQTDQSSSST